MRANAGQKDRESERRNGGKERQGGKMGGWGDGLLGRGLADSIKKVINSMWIWALYPKSA